MGGEEFVVLLPDTAESSALLVAERLHTVVSELDVPGVPQSVTASLGVAHLDPWDLAPAPCSNGPTRRSTLPSASAAIGS